jgi:nitroreductase
MAEARNETLGTIARLGTAHGNFGEREVSEEDLRTILEAATRAATASNQQSYSIIALEDRKAMKELTGYSGSRALVFCADGNRLEDAARRLGHEVDGPVGMETFTTWCVDALLAAQTACIAARSLGIDSMFTNGIGRKGLDLAFRLLELPERNCYPLITLILGYASGAESERRGRWTGAGLVHYGRYSRLDAAQADRMIAEYDDESKGIGFNYRYKDEGFEHYLDWHFVKWLGGFPAGTGDAAAKRLAESGFLAERPGA